MEGIMKKPFIIVILFVLVAGIIYTAVCLRNKNDPERALNYLKNLDSYSAEVHINIINDKQNIEYDTKQLYSNKYGYRLEVGEDRIMIYKEDKIQVEDLKNGLQYSTDRDFDSVFKLSFLGEYIGLIYTNESINFSVKELSGEKFQVVKLILPGMNRNIRYAELYINIKTCEPKYIIIYNDQDKEKMRIIYNKFLPNTKVDKELF